MKKADWGMHPRMGKRNSIHEIGLKTLKISFHERVAPQFGLHMINLYTKYQLNQPKNSWNENRIQKFRDYPLEI